MTRPRRKPHKPADPWSGIDPENRPTPERMKFGLIKPVDFKDKGDKRWKGKMAYDFAANPVALAHGCKALSDRQKDAADRFEEICETIHLRGGSRDSLDMSPRGHGEMSNSAAERLAQAQSDYRSARKQLHRWEDLVIHSVVLHHHKTGPYSQRRFLVLASGLDKLAEHWKIA